MRWAGGCPGHVGRSGEPYAGATRWLEPRTLDVTIPKPPIDWVTVIGEAAGSIGFLLAVIGLCAMLAITLG